MKFSTIIESEAPKPLSAYRKYPKVREYLYNWKFVTCTKCGIKRNRSDIHIGDRDKYVCQQCSRKKHICPNCETNEVFSSQGVIRCDMCLSMTGQDVASYLGISRERVRQLINKHIKKYGGTRWEALNAVKNRKA